jgi:hypothetical protein
MDGHGDYSQKIARRSSCVKSQKHGLDDVTNR